LLDRLEAGELPQEVQLDLMEAVDSSGIAPLAERLAAYRAARSTDDPLIAYSEALQGGNPDAGGRLVFQHPQAQCIRCHAVNGRGGDVGPELAGIGQRYSREQLLQSLVDPSAVIAPGYGAATVALRNGQTVQGVVSEESDTSLVLITGDGAPTTVTKADITERNDGTSAMPPMGLILTRRELRDVVAYLSSLQEVRGATGGQ
jgi:putative heme-binding domain-containing protein